MNYQDELNELMKQDVLPERFYRLWAAIAIKEGWPFSMGGWWIEGDASWAWEEWAETQGEMKPPATL